MNIKLVRECFTASRFSHLSYGWLTAGRYQFRTLTSLPWAGGAFVVGDDDSTLFIEPFMIVALDTPAKKGVGAATGEHRGGINGIADFSTRRA